MNGIANERGAIYGSNIQEQYTGGHFITHFGFSYSFPVSDRWKGRLGVRRLGDTTGMKDYR